MRSVLDLEFDCEFDCEFEFEIALDPDLALAVDIEIDLRILHHENCVIPPAHTVPDHCLSPEDTRQCRSGDRR